MGRNGDLLRNRSRGFALVAAIGVLAVLMILVIGAAGSAEFTVGFTRARQADRRLGFALEEGLALLPSRAPELMKARDEGAPPSTVAVIEGRPGTSADVVVSATVGLRPDPALLGSALALRDGDLLVRLDAARADGRGSRRSALFLINPAGQRRAPILLQESRP